MKLSDFNYNLPLELIAKSPSKPRDHSRLLVLDKKNGAVNHHTFYEIIDFLKSGDVLVVNNSKVFPARLFGFRKDTGGKVEILLNKNISEVSHSVISAPHFVIPTSHSVIPAKAGIQDGKSSIWEVIGKNLKPGTKINFEDSCLEAKVLSNENKISKIQFNLIGEEFFKEIEKIGHTPLPPYIRKNDTEKDKTDYQTVYAKPVGSAAAPTAGLHFTKELLNQIKAKGIEIVEVTLHVGLGTFAPVEAGNIEDHKIHSEYYTVKKEESDKIIKAKKEGRRIIAVGTTSTRVLETVFSSLHSPLSTLNFSGWTNIFIYPGYKFKCIDGVITNFHLPKSTLLMLVSAFAGSKNIKKAYEEAIEQKYRFFSYGDAMLMA
ncbi:MAG: tRNA preQ1(34) S-adenosylmethionine ribosyltransferase-isomerase QueA [Patescibacteria group bacterium]